MQPGLWHSRILLQKIMWTENEYRCILNTQLKTGFHLSFGFWNLLVFWWKLGTSSDVLLAKNTEKVCCFWINNAKSMSHTANLPLCLVSNDAEHYGGGWNFHVAADQIFIRGAENPSSSSDCPLLRGLTCPRSRSESTSAPQSTQLEADSVHVFVCRAQTDLLFGTGKVNWAGVQHRPFSVYTQPD